MATIENKKKKLLTNNSKHALIFLICMVNGHVFLNLVPCKFFLTLTNFEVRQNSEYSGISATHTKWDIKYGSSL